MAYPTSSSQPKSDDTDKLDKKLTIAFASSSSTSNADVDTPSTTAEPPNRSSKGPVVDKEGFITPYPIKKKQPPSKKKPHQPDSRGGKFPLKPLRSATQPQPEERSSASSKKGLGRNQQQRRGPDGEVRIGSLHSRTKSSAAGKSVTHQIHDGWIPVDATSKTALTDATNAGNAKKKTKHRTAPKPNITKKTRPVIVFDENNKLSWADEVIEEADREETFVVAVAAAAAAAAPAPAPAASRQSQAQIHGVFNRTDDRKNSKTKPTKSVRAGPAEQGIASSSKNDNDKNRDKDQHVLKQRMIRRNRNPPVAGAGAGVEAAASTSSPRPHHEKDQNQTGSSNFFSLLDRNVEC